MIARRALLASSLAAPALAQAPWRPDRTVRLICPWTPGGSTDIYLRGLAPLLAKHIGQGVVVENRAGASGAVALSWLKGQAPDGNVVAGITDASVRVALTQRVDYDPLEDIAYLGGSATLNFGWAVRNDSPLRELNQLVAEGRARPEAISFAGGGTPANPPFGMRLLELRTGAKFLFVPFAGGGQMINAVLARDVDLVFDAMGGLAGVLGPGAPMRLIGIAAEERSARYPEVPTAREQGHDVVYDLPVGVVAPRGVPASVAAAWETAILRVADDPDHAALVDRLNLSPWRRDARAYAEHQRRTLGELPDLYRALGIQTVR